MENTIWNKYPKTGFQSSQGRRPTMEDTHILINSVQEKYPELAGKLGNKLCSYWGVYDGHGGKEAAELAQKILHDKIICDPCFVEGNIKQAILNGFKAADEEILTTSEKEKWHSGTTVVVAILFDNKLWIANCGDSEALAGRRILSGKDKNADKDKDKNMGTVVGKGQYHEWLLLSHKHKPNDPIEKDRIKAAGGHVVFGRVMGSLAVARSLGDREFKHPFNHGEADFVSWEPYISCVEFTPDFRYEFLIISCDGLWEKMSYEAAAELVVDWMHTDNKGPEEVAQLLVTQSLDRGSFDNVTAIMVYFPWQRIAALENKKNPAAHANNTTTTTSNGSSTTSPASSSVATPVTSHTNKNSSTSTTSSSNNHTSNKGQTTASSVVVAAAEEEEEEEEDAEAEMDVFAFLKDQYEKKKLQEQKDAAAAAANSNNNNSSSNNSSNNSSNASPTTGQKSKGGKSEAEILKYFALSGNQTVLQSFFCSLEKNPMFFPGILLITEKHLCFYSKFMGKLIAEQIEINDIQSIERQKSFILTNAIKVTTQTGKKLTFNWRQHSHTRDLAFNSLLELFNKFERKPVISDTETVATNLTNSNSNFPTNNNTTNNTTTNTTTTTTSNNTPPSNNSNGNTTTNSTNSSSTTTTTHSNTTTTSTSINTPPASAVGSSTTTNTNPSSNSSNPANSATSNHINH